MIDYEKLKIAHELAKKIDCVCEYVISPKHPELDLFKIKYGYDDGHRSHTQEYHTDDIDKLIEKLQSLLEEQKAAPKYKIGQEVWRVNDEWLPEPFTIRQVNAEASEIIYRTDDSKDWWLEEKLYPTPEALIDAQIEYWQSLSERNHLIESLAPKDIIDSAMKCIAEENEMECHHESDGNVTALLCNPPRYQFKCKHCGEFY